MARYYSRGAVFGYGQNDSQEPGHKYEHRGIYDSSGADLSGPVAGTPVAPSCCADSLRTPWSQGLWLSPATERLRRPGKVRLLRFAATEVGDPSVAEECLPIIHLVFANLKS